MRGMTRKKRLNYDHLKKALRNPAPQKTNDEPTFCFSLITSPFSLYRPKVVLGHMQPSSVQTLDECGRPSCALRSHWSRILFSNTDLLILIWIESIHPILYSWIHFLLFCLFESFPSCFTRIQACWMHPFPQQMMVSFFHLLKKVNEKRNSLCQTVIDGLAVEHLFKFVFWRNSPFSISNSPEEYDAGCERGPHGQFNNLVIIGRSGERRRRLYDHHGRLRPGLFRHPLLLWRKAMEG